MVWFAEEVVVVVAPEFCDEPDLLPPLVLTDRREPEETRGQDCCEDLCCCGCCLGGVGCCCCWAVFELATISEAKALNWGFRCNNGARAAVWDIVNGFEPKLGWRLAAAAATAAAAAAADDVVVVDAEELARDCDDEGTER